MVRKSHAPERLAPIASTQPRKPAEPSIPVPIVAPELTHTPALVERIRARAYELYVERGFQHGHDVQDWLDAEAEIIARANLAA